MDENQETSAAEELTQAAEEAVASQEVTQETEETTEDKQVAETTEEVVEESADELPEDHKERSDLGRKLSAYHRRMDEIDNKFDHIAKSLESLRPKEEDPIEALEPDEPITRKEMENILAAREAKQKSSEQSYNENYVRTISGLGVDLSQTDYDAVLAEMKDITYDPSENPGKDAEMNFQAAQIRFLKKKMAQPAEKTNPLKGEAPRDTLGVAKSQNVVAREVAAPKLDADAQSYMDYVKRTDGDEKAAALLKD